MVKRKRRYQKLGIGSRTGNVKVYDRDRYLFFKKIIVEHYGKRCVCCGEENMWFLSLDHINNDGYKYGRSRVGFSPADIVRHNFPKDLQLLCYNCNQGKNNPINKYICPHKFI